MSDAQVAMIATGIVLAVALAVYGLWVSNYSRGYDRKAWHRPLAAGLGVAAGAVFIIAAWMGV